MGTITENSVNSGEVSLETILSEALEIEGYPDYRVSPQGFVVSLKKAPRILKSAGCGYGQRYQFVGLCSNGRPKSHYVHRLVASAFLPNPEGKPEVNHKDGNPRNNALDNLEWVTAQENSAHAHGTGASPTGHACSWAKLSKEQVEAVCILLQDGKDTASISEMTGVPSKTVWKIRRKKAWKSVSEGYKF